MSKLNFNRKTRSEVPNYNISFDKSCEYKEKESSELITKIIPKIKFDDNLEVHNIRAYDSKQYNLIPVGTPKNTSGALKDNSSIYLENSEGEIIKTSQNREIQENLKINSKVSNNDFTSSKPKNASITNKINNTSLSEMTKHIMKEEDIPFEEELKFVEEFLKSEGLVENEHATSEYFVTFQIDEFVAFLFAMISVGSGVIYHELKLNGKLMKINETLLNMVMFTALNMVSVSAALFCK